MQLLYTCTILSANHIAALSVQHEHTSSASSVAAAFLARRLLLHDERLLELFVLLLAQQAGDALYRVAHQQTRARARLVEQRAVLLQPAQPIFMCIYTGTCPCTCLQQMCVFENNTISMQAQLTHVHVQYITNTCTSTQLMHSHAIVHEYPIACVNRCYYMYMYMYNDLWPTSASWAPFLVVTTRDDSSSTRSSLLPMMASTVPSSVPS